MTCNRYVYDPRNHVPLGTYADRELRMIFSDDGLR